MDRLLPSTAFISVPMKQVHPHLLSYIFSGIFPLLHETGLFPVRCCDNHPPFLLWHKKRHQPE